MEAKRKILRLDKNNLLAEELETEPKKKKKAEKRFFTTISLASQIGFTISLPIVGGAILGQFLDNKFSTSPRLTLSLIFTGLFIGILNVYNIIKEIQEN